VLRECGTTAVPAGLDKLEGLCTNFPVFDRTVIGPTEWYRWNLQLPNQFLELRKRVQPCTISPSSGTIGADYSINVTPGNANQFLTLTTTSAMANQILTVFDTNTHSYAFTLLGLLVPPGGDHGAV